MLAHALEANGIATVGISSVRDFAVRMKSPRILHCDFPMGRPFGLPGDRAFQKRVLMEAFSLLAETEGPILRDFEESILDNSGDALSCAVPPRIDPSRHAAVDEAEALRPAYNRATKTYGVSSVGRVSSADNLPKLVQKFVDVVEGTHWKDVDFPGGNVLEATKDIMSYYEEAALDLAGHVPAARMTENWFFNETETGKLLKDARVAMQEQGASFWFYVAPFTQV